MDHLRFFAALIVIAYHYTFWFPNLPEPIPLFRHGYSGVWLFMVLSGFIFGVITYGKQIDVWRFYLNRALRIYPLLIFVVALGYFSVPADTLSFLLALTPVSNVARMHYGPYGGVLWSVAVELQFYLLLPALLIFLRQRWYGPGLILFTIILRTGVWLLIGTVHDFTYLSIFGALDLFLIGMACGNLHQWRGLWRPRAWLLLPLFVSINFILWRVDDSHENALWIVWPTLQGAMFGAFVLVYLECAWQLPLAFVWAYLGKISYSIYVWHTLVFLVAVKFNQPLIVLPVTVGLAALSYWLIEEPFLSLRVRYIR